MTPAQSREALLSLPAESREKVATMLNGAWDDGFGAGAAQLPRKNPFASLFPPAPPVVAGKPKGKAR